MAHCQGALPVRPTPVGNVPTADERQAQRPREARWRHAAARHKNWRKNDETDSWPRHTETRIPDAARAKRPPAVGAPGLEPGTSALSGPRSNHLSYAPERPCRPQERPKPGNRFVVRSEPNSIRPVPKTKRTTRAHSNIQTSSQHHLAPTHSACAWRPCRPLDSLARGTPRGSVPMLPRLIARRLDRSGTHMVRPLPRKEVIQPQLPLRLPCYDFVPITSPALDGCLLGNPGWPPGFRRCRLS